MTRWVTAAALWGVGGLHLLWATGSHFPARDERALARRVTGADVMPPRAASAVVGVGLGLVGVLATRPTAYAPTLTLTRGAPPGWPCWPGRSRQRGCCSRVCACQSQRQSSCASTGSPTARSASLSPQDY